MKRNTDAETSLDSRITSLVKKLIWVKNGLMTRPGRPQTSDPKASVRHIKMSLQRPRPPARAGTLLSPFTSSQTLTTYKTLPVRQGRTIPNGARTSSYNCQNPLPGVLTVFAHFLLENYTGAFRAFRIKTSSPTNFIFTKKKISRRM